MQERLKFFLRAKEIKVDCKQFTWNSSMNSTLEVIYSAQWGEGDELFCVIVASFFLSLYVFFLFEQSLPLRLSSSCVKEGHWYYQTGRSGSFYSGHGDMGGVSTVRIC